MSRDVTLYVSDMIAACRRVVEYSEGVDRERLQADSMRNDAIVRNLEIAWRRVAGLLAHAYFAIDRDIVWNVVSTEVPALASIEQVTVRAEAKGGRRNSEGLIRDLPADLSAVARSAKVEALTAFIGGVVHKQPPATLADPRLSA